MIQPGRAGELRTTLDTSELSGPIGKGISITTNDAYIPKFQVVVRARVLGSVELSPGNKAILSNRIPQTKGQAFLIRKEPGETGELVVGSVRASVPWIETRVERVGERRPASDGLPTALPGDWILRTTLAAALPSGRTQEWVRFETGLPREPEIEIHIATDLYPPVTLNSPEITVVAGRPTVLLASLRQDIDPQPVRLTAPEGLIVRTEPGRRRFFKIHLEWNGEPPGAPLELLMEVAGETQTIPVTVTAAN